MNSDPIRATSCRDPAVGVMFFTFTDPKIVVKSLFPILLPSGRGVVKIWGLFFWVQDILKVSLGISSNPSKNDLYFST